MPVTRPPARSALMSALRYPLRPVYSGAAVNPYAAFNAVVQALYTSTAASGVWFDGVDPSYRTVNSDGTGGIPAIDAAFGRLTDRTGGGRHAVQAVVNNQPIAKSGFVSFAVPSYPYGGPNVRRYLQAASGSSGTMRSTSGVIICDIQTLPIENIPVSGMTQTRTTNAYPCTKSFLAWRCGPSGYELYVDKKLFTGSALAASAVLAPFLGVAAAQGDAAMKFYAFVSLDTYLGSTDFANLRAAAENFSGASAFTNDVILGFGDSNMRGAYLSDSTPWLSRLASIPTARTYNLATTGAGLSSTLTLVPNRLTMYLDSGALYAVACTGINTITVGNASDIAETLRARMLSLQNEGFKTIVCTYPANTAQANTFNGKIRTDGPSDYAVALADVQAVPQLSNTANATYFQPDALHMTDAAQPFMQASVDAAITAMLPLPYPLFTATPYNGTSVNAAFTNASIGATSYGWDFTNDASIDSTSTSPTNNYAVDGEYTPRLVATSAAGSATRLRRFYINKRASLAASTTALVGQYVLNTGITQALGLASAWADQSGAGNDLTQATGANQPSVDGSGILTFDGSNDYMQTTNFGLGVPLTFMLRVKINSLVASRIILDGLNTGSRHLRISAAANRLCQYYAGSENAHTDVIVAGSYLTIFCGVVSDFTGTVVLGVKLSGKDWVLSDYNAGSASGGITLGAGFSGLTPASFSIKGALIYSGGISRAAIAQNEAYLDSL